jgi:hypothetical protein
MNVNRLALLIVTGAAFAVACSIVTVPVPVSAEGNRYHLFVCRSPLLAFEFWRALQDTQRQGVTIPPKIAEEICNGYAGGYEDRQCLRVEADAFKPVASGWGGALAMTDGTTKVWFHNPDGGGWVHPDYYMSYLNSSSH